MCTCSGVQYLQGITQIICGVYVRVVAHLLGWYTAPPTCARCGQDLMQDWLAQAEKASGRQVLSGCHLWLLQTLAAAQLDARLCSCGAWQQAVQELLEHQAVPVLLTLLL